MKNAPTIALAVIAKDEAQRIGQMLDSSLPYVDALYLTNTGSMDSTVQIAEDKCKANGVAFHLSRFEWIKDFAAARNFNFKDIKEDWILWLDCDDVLRNGKAIKDILVLGEEEQLDGIAVLYNYEFSESGAVRTVHWKERILKNNGWFKWIGKIHEAVVGQRPANLVKIQDIWIDHQTTPERQTQSAARNLEILLAQ